MVMSDPLETYQEQAQSVAEAYLETIDTPPFDIRDTYDSHFLQSISVAAIDLVIAELEVARNRFVNDSDGWEHKMFNARIAYYQQLKGEIEK
jgi:hypothetical protein